EIWTWGIFKVQLPVTCGDLEGILNRDRLSRGEKCILVKSQWFSPSEFEQLAGKEANKNWKLSIRCKETPLGKLIKVMSRCVCVTSCRVAPLTVRLPSGTCGRSIRTETRWMTPVNFVKEASCQTDVSWKLQIKCEGKALGELVKDRVVDVHSLLCNCCLCLPDSKDLNDDECWICRGEGTEGESLVECDECPRSFHQKCHLPHVPDALLEFTDAALIVSLQGQQPLDISHVGQKTLSLLPGLDDEDCLFKSDPCHLPEYTRVIRTPMSLDQVTDKLQRDRYETVGQFVSDIQLIFSNCASYNRVRLFIGHMVLSGSSLTKMSFFCRIILSFFPSVRH
uniref:SP110 nuclear body protein, tandem duplicate 1 n=1 Tax=Periophthalmus magnuspinnatus TaxID=409849 RepID=A0A3B3Z9D8_9GOBI